MDKSTRSIRPTTPTQAHHAVGTQPHAGTPARTAGLAPGQQTGRFNNALFRTAAAGTRPGVMARAMMAKLRPRAKQKGHDVDGHAEPIDMNESAEEASGGGFDEAIDGDGEGEGKGGSGHGGHPSQQGQQQGQQQRQQKGSDEQDPPEGGGLGHARRLRSKANLRPAPAACLSATVLRAEWATTALAAGGESELRRALARQLLTTIRGPGTAGWRKPWVGNVAAAYAAAGATSFQPRGFPGVRDLLIELTAATPAYRLLPNPMRETLYCLLPLVLFDLQRARTGPQRQDLFARLAALSRAGLGPRRF